MSSYNENLRSNILASLQSQELELKKVKAKKNASMFTLYYAEGATLKASEQLESTTALWKNKMAVKAQAVENSNLSNNLLDSANQASQYVKQSITNSSVCAANVQLAANSIVRLASDLGSIYGIVNAADAKSDIYQLADESRKLINKTAYDAEQASQIAMEASMRTSEVTASIVQDKAKANNDLMNNVLKIISDEFTAVSQLGLAEDATLASTSSIEKKAEGDYLDITVDYKASKAAYKASNKGLNLNLQVYNKSSTGFSVSFEAISMPFSHLQRAANSAANTYYPVKNYYLVVVKDSKKSTFTISNAENLLINDLAAEALSTPSSTTGTSTTGTSTTASPENTQNTTQKGTANPKMGIIPVIPSVLPQSGIVAANAGSTETQQTPPVLVTQNINFQEMMFTQSGPFSIQDSDGDDVKLGVRYVVFVLGLYTDDYKKKLNCFDDFLSAPSPSFILTNELAAVDGDTISKSFEPTAKGTHHTHQINFSVTENPAFSPIVEYRCIFLPPNDPYAGFLLNKQFTAALNNEVELLEEIADKYDPMIAMYEADMIRIQNYLGLLNGKLESINEDLKDPGNTNTDQLNGDKNAVQTQIDLQNINLQNVKSSLADQTKAKQDSIDSIKTSAQSGNIEFLFTLKLAEQVLAGNYTVAKQILPQTELSAPTQKKTKGNTPENDPSQTQNQPENPYKPTTTNWEVIIGPDVTDNFGNPLVHDTEYVPVILSYCTAVEENLAMFTNNWSGYNNSPKLLYKKSHS